MAMIYQRPSYCPTCMRLRVESVAPAVQPQESDTAASGLNDARLAEMETHHTKQQDDQEAWCYGCGEAWPCDGMVLIAEVRRLRRALQLSEASRGMPGVGRD